MGFRFRRRVKIAPGVGFNLSKRGVGISAGPRGLQMGVGPRGGHFSVGAPGTGLSFRKDAIKHRRRERNDDLSESTTVAVQLKSDGTVTIVDADGKPLPPKLVKVVRDNHGDELQAFLEQQCSELNAGAEAIARVHLSTPGPDDPARYEPRPFDVARPEPFVPESLGILGWLLPGRRSRIRAENEAGRQAWTDSLEQWEADRKRHEQDEARREVALEEGLRSDQEVMENVLEERLSSLAWPRETIVSFELHDEGRSAFLDVDLPEVEDMPDKTASVASRGLKVNIKNKSDTQVRKDYMHFIHAILFRVIGETFATLPELQEVVASGYSQRPDPATGNIRDDYLISTRATRTDWEAINFRNLEAVDVIDAFDQFELRRKMTKTGVFKPVEPLAMPDRS